MTLIPEMNAVLGGALIGAAAVLLYATQGRIAGISGIAYGLAWNADRAWRAVFLVGLVGGAALVAHGLSHGLPTSADNPHWLLVLAGVLVGFGTRLGNGCTSGHGICGLSRQSPRSLVSVLIFMATGIVAATLIRPLLT